MATSKEYLAFVSEQLADVEEVSYRAMMGEYVLYYRGKVVGGIYDNRVLVKPVQAVRDYLPNAPYEIPYPGAKEMLLVEEVDRPGHLEGLFRAMYDELPMPKPRKKKA